MSYLTNVQSRITRRRYTMTNKYREYEAEKRRLAAECKTQAEYEERLRELVERLKI